jgi:hypothetical protein
MCFQLGDGEMVDGLVWGPVGGDYHSDASMEWQRVCWVCLAARCPPPPGGAGEGGGGGGGGGWGGGGGGGGHWGGLGGGIGGDIFA